MKKFLISIILIFSLFFSFGNFQTNAQISEKQEKIIEKFLDNYWNKNVKKYGEEKVLFKLKELYKKVSDLEKVKTGKIKDFLEVIGEKIKKFVNKITLKSIKKYPDLNLEIFIINDNVKIDKKFNRLILAGDSSGTDTIVVYTKKSNESIDEAIKKISLEENKDIDFTKCEIKKDGDKIYLNYKKKYNKNLCSHVGCDYELNYIKEAKQKCGKFVNVGFEQYFLYQPENINDKFAFISHFGLDPYTYKSINFYK